MGNSMYGAGLHAGIKLGRKQMAEEIASALSSRNAPSTGRKLVAAATLALALGVAVHDGTQRIRAKWGTRLASARGTTTDSVRNNLLH
jgi:hypothetical protein